MRIKAKIATQSINKIKIKKLNHKYIVKTFFQKFHHGSLETN